MTTIRFRLLPEHLTLLAHANVGYNDHCEYGAPEICPKRPYGNSGSLIERDIAWLLGWIARDEKPTAGQAARGRELHEQTGTALAIVLSTQSFVPGLYEREQYGGTWRMVT